MSLKSASKKEEHTKHDQRFKHKDIFKAER